MSEEEESDAFERVWVIHLEGHDLNTVEGQQYLLNECQKALAQGDTETEADVNAAKQLIASIKVKKDIDALKMMQAVFQRLAEINKKLENKVDKDQIE